MRKTSRPIAALFLLGTAACASQATPPRTAPEPTIAAHPSTGKSADRAARVPQGGGEPLYVVDGAVQAGLPTWLRASDIDQIRVVRGAEAAPYGERAANGVIVITTRSPGS